MVCQHLKENEREAELYLDHEAFAKSPLKLAVMFLSVVNIWLIRKNGSYILIAIAVLFVIRSIRKRLSKRPALVRYLGNISFWFYVLIIVTVLSLVFRLDDFILLALSWFTVVFVILGPVIQGHPRYMFPAVYVMPATVLFMLGRMRDKQKNS